MTLAATGSPQVHLVDGASKESSHVAGAHAVRVQRSLPRLLATLLTSMQQNVERSCSSSAPVDTIAGCSCGTRARAPSWLRLSRRPRFPLRRCSTRASLSAAVARLAWYRAIVSRSVAVSTLLCGRTHASPYLARITASACSSSSRISLHWRRFAPACTRRR
jgi:hypothetical protein